MLIVSIGGVEPCGPNGRQWSLVQGVTEENRQQRIDAIMSTFTDIVRHQQEKSGVSPLVITLVGFSRGAIMSLESIRAVPDLASGVIALNGRYATLPMTATTAITTHLIHGGEGRVTDLAWVVPVQEALQQAGGDMTLDAVDDLGHAINDCSIQFVIECPRHTVPKYYLGETLSGSTPKGDDIIGML